MAGGLFFISADLIAFLAALIAGVLLAGWLKRRADRIQEATGERPATWHVRLASVVLPPALVLVALGFHLGYPELRGFNFQDGIHLRNSLLALTLALALYTSAFIAEVVRAGILSVSHGQTEAAYALGLRPNRTMNLIILPQALRVIIPPLISQYLNLTKNSSLAIAVGYMDITGTLGGHEPDGPRTRMRHAADAVLPGDLAVGLGGDELVQQPREAGGALRWRICPTFAPKCCPSRRRRRPRWG